MRSIIDMSADTSVLINSVACPIQYLPKVLGRFCLPLKFYNEYKNFPISISGSCLQFRHNNKLMLLCTRHQIDNQNRVGSEVAIVFDNSNGSKEIMTVCSTAKPEGDDTASQPLKDIFLATFEPEWKGDDLSRFFLDLPMDTTHHLYQVPVGNIKLIFAMGFPSNLINYDSSYNEEGACEDQGLMIDAKGISLPLKHDDRKELDDDWLIPMQMEAPPSENFNPDGLSGSPVFFVYFDELRQAKLGFAGMIVKATKQGRFSVYNALHIKQYISQLEAGAETITLREKK